MTIISWRSSLL